ncbi:MAG: exopolysaccharide biosynthesis polyprenyl glycosylphosphotransferase, partial [Gemmatimonadaceae bacterium]|nr:exopolysaccharide biosynthesis polyprenyl glycosylphosphotransferase [Gemmatimonadaceae bacterium]
MTPSAKTTAHPARSSALDFRARLSDRQPDAARRHTARLATRIGILLASDLAAFVLARTVLRTFATQPLVASRLPKNLTSLGPLGNPGDPGSMVFLVALLLALALTGSYTRHRGLNTAVRLGAAAALAIAAAAVPLAALVGVPRAVAEMIVIGTVAWAALLIVRALTERFLERVWPRDRWAGPAILVGPADALSSRAAIAVSRPGGDYTVVAHHCIPDSALPGSPHSLARDVHALIEKTDAEAVVLCEPLPEQYVRALLDTVLETGCQLLYPARAVRIEDPRPRLVWHHDQPFFELGAPVLKMGAVAVKRVTDVVMASILLAVSLPVMLVVAAGTKLDSRGPVFFRQQRAGRGGRRFDMMKFRTMRIGADEEKLQLAHLNHTGDARLFKILSDPRVTPFGRFLRRWSLDELPQLWNVLRGDMSLVGPRPFFESDFAAYEDHHFRRLDTKPGITGLWQVSGRSEVVDFEDVVVLDRQYIEQWSLWLDVSILFRT